jgi:hypothetical protein
MRRKNNAGYSFFFLGARFWTVFLSGFKSSETFGSGSVSEPRAQAPRPIDRGALIAFPRKLPLVVPLKHRRYPWWNIQSKERSMTIAAGFVHSGGVLMAADTLISGGAISRHQSKITGYRFDDGTAVFAFAGLVDYAEAAIQQCEGPLRPRFLTSASDLR